MGHTHGVEVILDGVAFSERAASISAALRAASETARTRGRIVVEVRADGERVPDAMLAGEAADLATIKVLSFVSANPRHLVTQTLRDAAAALNQATADQQRVCELVQSGETAEAIDPLRSVLSTWQAVRDVVDRGGALLGEPLQNLNVGVEDGARSVAEATSGLREALRSLKDAMENEDWAAVSDTVGYDLDAQSRRWVALLLALADALERV